jgi:hypothetical protein
MKDPRAMGQKPKTLEFAIEHDRSGERLDPSQVRHFGWHHPPSVAIDGDDRRVTIYGAIAHQLADFLGEDRSRFTMILNGERFEDCLLSAAVADRCLLYWGQKKQGSTR